MTRLELLVMLGELKAKSTQVTAWYPHGEDGTVRGPFVRWFKCTEVAEQYQRNVASQADDCRYAAAALTHVPELIKIIEQQRDALLACHRYFGVQAKTNDCHKYMSQTFLAILEEETKQ